MIRATLLALALAGATLAHAQEVPAQCVPDAHGGSELASPPYLYFSPLGVCVRYRCYLAEFSAQFPSGVQDVTYCGLLSELPKVGGRLQTILKAADPLRSLQTAGQRFPISPLGDPAFAALLADLFPRR